VHAMRDNGNNGSMSLGVLSTFFALLWRIRMRCSLTAESGKLDAVKC